MADPAQMAGMAFGMEVQPEYAAGQQYEQEAPEDGAKGSKGQKLSLAERNRERQQRFRQRQKSRIEELEQRCVRLTQQTRTLTTEKEEMAKNISLLKDLVQVRELQIVAVTSRLAQLTTGIASMPNLKTEGVEGVASVETLLQQQPTVQALEAIQHARAEAQAEVANLQAANLLSGIMPPPLPQIPLDASSAGHLPAQPQIPPAQSSQAAQEPPQAGAGPSSNASEPLPAPIPIKPPSRASTPHQQRPMSPLALDQLCRVAEIAEQQGGKKPTVSSAVPQPLGIPTTLAQPPPLNLSAITSIPIRPASPHVPSPPSIFSRMSRGFEKCADVTLVVEGQQVVVHSALLAAHSAYYARKLEEMKHSQNLFPSSKEPVLLDTGGPGKRIQDMELFLRHCYGTLDINPVADADVMRLVMLADEFQAKQLLSDCDDAIVLRADGKKFTFFVELSNGGDMVDWIRLADQLGLRKVSAMCEMHLARHLKDNRNGRENARLNELGQECLLRVINQLAEL